MPSLKLLSNLFNVPPGKILLTYCINITNVILNTKSKNITSEGGWCYNGL